jgi:hypothetical protein
MFTKDCSCVLLVRKPMKLAGSTRHCVVVFITSFIGGKITAGSTNTAILPVLDVLIIFRNYTDSH